MKRRTSTRLFVTRIRFEAYESHCGYERGVSMCPESPARCRSAIKGIMGTILNTNCTCAYPYTNDTEACEVARWKLQGLSACKGTSSLVFDSTRAILNFKSQHMTVGMKRLLIYFRRRPCPLSLWLPEHHTSDGAENNYTQSQGWSVDIVASCVPEIVVNLILCIESLHLRMH